jgi:Type II secretion system (T2SS), protein G
MSHQKGLLRLIGRLIVAAAGGVVVAAAAFVCTYFDQRDLISYRDRQLHVVRKLDTLEEAIILYRRATGQFPTDLAELPAAKFYHQFTINAEGKLVDVWDQPYLYRVEGDSFEIYSLGADGQPGGVGRDADLYPSSAGRPPELPTLRQFTFNLPTKEVQRTCIAAGVCAALIGLVVTRNRRGAARLALICATAIASIIIAMAINSMRMSPGH